MDISNPLTVGEIYQIKRKKKESLGVLLSVEKHLTREDPFLTFYTNSNTVEEFYAEEVTLTKDSDGSDEIHTLLHRYFQEESQIQRLSEEIKRLQMQRRKHWEAQERLGEEMVKVTGIDERTSIHDFFQTADEVELSQMQILAESMSRTAKNTVDTLKETKNVKSLKEKLGYKFDQFWEYMDARG